MEEKYTKGNLSSEEAQKEKRELEKEKGHGKMSVEEAGHFGGQKVRRLIEEGEEKRESGQR